MSQDYTVHRDMHMLMNDNVLRIQTVQDYTIANEAIMWVFYSYPPIWQILPLSVHSSAHELLLAGIGF